MPENELRRLLRVPLQPFREAHWACAAQPAAEVPLSNVVLRVKRRPAARDVDTVRISFSTTHDITDFLQFIHARYHEFAPAQERHSWTEPADWDWRGREFRRMLRTWTPQSYVDIAVHPANLTFLPPGKDIAVSGDAAGDHDLGHLMAKLLAPLAPDTVSQVMAAVVTHLGLAELRGAARSLHQKRLSRNASLASEGTAAGPQPATPSRSLVAAARRLPRRLSLRPPLHRALPARRGLRFATA